MSKSLVDEQVSRCIDLLKENGTAGLSTDTAKQIEDEIWELRPGKNRVFFFYHRHGTYVLLHHRLASSLRQENKQDTS